MNSAERPRVDSGPLPSRQSRSLTLVLLGLTAILLWVYWSILSWTHTILGPTHQVSGSIIVSLLLTLAVLAMARHHHNRNSVTFRDDAAKSKQEAAEAQTLLQTILDGTPAGILLLDEERVIRRANRTAEHVHGCMLVGQNCYDVLSDPGHCRDCGALRAIQTDRPCAGSHDHADQRTGEVFNVAHYPVHLPNGERGVVLVEHVVTQERQALDALKQSERRYRDLYENTPMMYFTLDAEGKVTSVNAHGARELGYRVAELIGSPVLNVFHEEDRDKVQRQLRSLVDGDETVRRWEARKRCKNGKVINVAETVRVVTGDDSQIVILVVCENISERKHSEARLGDYRDALRGLSLDLALAEERERRRIAIGLHDQVGQGLSLAKLRLQELRQARTESRRESAGQGLNRLLDQTIHSCRSLTFDLSSPVLYELGLEAAIKQLGNLLETSSGIRVSFSFDPEPISIPEELAIILHRSIRELLRNVAQHSGADSVRLSISTDGAMLRVVVEDDGKGMAPERMVPTRNPGGYGLFSVSEQLLSVGGNLVISSVESGGTRMLISVPLTDVAGRQGLPDLLATRVGGEDPQS